MNYPWLYHDGYNYHQMPYSYNRMEDTPELPSSFIDPSLQSLTPTPVYPTTMDQHQSMQRQLKEEQKTIFFNPNNSPQATFMPSTMEAMTPYQVRHSTPFSVFEVSEASGSAQSPTADTNTEPPTYFETHSPLQKPLPLEDFGFSQNHFIQFAGMGLGNNDSFVNPMDVNSTGQLDGYDSETSTPEFPLPQLVNSWESCMTSGMSVSGCDMKTMQQHQQHQQHNSSIVGCTKPYRSAPQEKQVKEQSPITVPLNLKRIRETDDNDDEYLPTVKRTTTMTKPRTTTTRRGRRGRAPTSNSPIIHRPHQPTRTLPSTTKALTPNSSKVLLCPHQPCQQSQSQSQSHHHGFKDQPSLDAHIKKQHSRPFICVFSFAGCDSTFGSKNEWKRHVASQHLVLEYWLCREGECANVNNNVPTLAATVPSRSGRRAAVQTLMMEEDDDSDAPVLPSGAIFNRKDLYTQHVRRMHLPDHLKTLFTTSSSTSNAKKTGALLLTDQNQDLNSFIATLRSRAQVKRCSLPTYMRCSVRSCTHAPFNGTEAWDSRMEHVAKHLESFAAATASGTRTGPEVDKVLEEHRVEFGSEYDTTLTEWAVSREVGIIRRVKVGDGKGGETKWVMRDPIKRRGHGGNGSGNGSGCGVGRGGRSGRQQRKTANIEEEIVVQTQ